ncbi:MAG: AbfB domain-containing protein [Planctomycetes bacterium]|nr:AbfB domain-containing protein [Planctomycetota bacterium]
MLHSYRATHNLLFAVLASVLMSFQASTYADSVEDNLATAKLTYEQGREDAKEAVILDYRKLIGELTEKKMLEAATRTQDEMKILEKDGRLLARPEMMPAFGKYGEAQKKLADELTDAYAKAAAEYVKAGELDKADEVRRELATRALPAKVISLKLIKTSTYVQHASNKGVVRPAPGIAERLNGTFELVNGLAESGYVSIRSPTFPDHYLNHGNLRIQLSPRQDNAGFRANATFKRVKGLGLPSAVSFESLNFPNHYIRDRNGELWVDKNDKSAKFKQESTFTIADPLFKLW